MLKRLTQLTIIGFLLCSLPMPVEARSSSSSSSSRSSPSSSSSKSASPSSSSKSTSFSTGTSRSSSNPSSQSSSKPTTSYSNSTSPSSIFNASYSSRSTTPTKVVETVTTKKPSSGTILQTPYTVPAPANTKTETRYQTVFRDSGTVTIPIIVPVGYPQTPVVLPTTYYPATTVVTDGEWTIWGVIWNILSTCFVIFVILIIIAGVR